MFDKFPLKMKRNIFSESQRLFTVARLQGMFSIIVDSKATARQSLNLLFYSIACALLVTITLQWALYKLFTRLYLNTTQEVVQTILITSKYMFLEWKIIFGYLNQIVQRNSIADLLNEASKIENYFDKFRLNRPDPDYRYWCSAKSYSNWFQIITIFCSFAIGCLMYTKNVAIGDIIVFIITTYCQIMPTILSSMYFFHLSLSFKFYRAISRKIRSFKYGGCDYRQIDRLNCFFNVVTKYTENVCKLFSIQILATLFYACALVLVEVLYFQPIKRIGVCKCFLFLQSFFLYYNIAKFGANKNLFELYGDLVKNFGLISCFVVEIYFICTIADLVMAEV